MPPLLLLCPRRPRQKSADKMPPAAAKQACGRGLRFLQACAAGEGPHRTADQAAEPGAGGCAGRPKNCRIAR